jgi:hypothetical protein
MTSLAITDGLLCLIATAAVVTNRLPLAFRMGSALLAVTAGLGVLRFSDLLPLPTLHSFFSTFSASSAFLLMAVSTVWNSSAGATRAKYASILLTVSGAIGFVMVDLFELTRFGQVVAVLCVLQIIVYSARHALLSALVGAIALELGFILFATGQRVPNLLQPGDFLHLLTAAGLVLLVWYHRRSPHASPLGSR